METVCFSTPRTTLVNSDVIRNLGVLQTYFFPSGFVLRDSTQLYISLLATPQSDANAAEVQLQLEHSTPSLPSVKEEPSRSRPQAATKSNRHWWKRSAWEKKKERRRIKKELKTANGTGRQYGLASLSNSSLSIIDIRCLPFMLNSLVVELWNGSRKKVEMC